MKAMQHEYNTNETQIENNERKENKENKRKTNAQVI